MGRKDYRRWGLVHDPCDEEETEISIEEQLILEDHGENVENCSTYSTQQTQLTLNGSRVVHRNSNGHGGKRSLARTSLRLKIQLIGLSACVLFVGFIAGFSLAVRHRRGDSDPPDLQNIQQDQQQSPSISSTENTPSFSTYSSSSSNFLNHELNESAFHKLVGQVNGENIRHNLKRMSQEVHMAGSKEGRSMAFAIRDLWRSYGLLGVRVEQHKVSLTRANNYNYLQVYSSGNESLIFETSRVAEDDNLPNSIPFIAYSTAADFNGSLIYAHFGRFEDFSYLESVQQLYLNGSIALIRFSNIHPSKVALTASAFGVRGILFYPDPAEFGPLMPARAVVRSTIQTLGQIHEYQKKGRPSPYAHMGIHTISFTDAEKLFRLMKHGEQTGKYSVPTPWQGGIRDLGGDSRYPVESPGLTARLRIFNEEVPSSIFNVVAAIPGLESDRYIIVGGSHDSWTSGAAEPGISLSILTEIARVFAVSVSKGWKPRRSILFISWDANLHGSSGAYHWLQEHHYEIVSRAIAYIDLTRLIQGNQTLSVFSSPILKEVARKAIQRIKHFDINSQQQQQQQQIPSTFLPQMGTIQFSTFLPNDEPSFAFYGNGIPFIRLALTNAPKGHDYPLFHTSFDTYENFQRLVDPTFSNSETIGRILSGLVVLLADSPILPFNVEDWVEEIQKSFGTFMSQYQDILHKANLSIGYLQASVMRLEVIGDNFRTEVHNRSLIVNNEHEHELNEHSPDASSHILKSKKSLFHRIINDKMMNLERALLSTRNSNVYKHQVMGFSRCTKLDYSAEGSNSKCSVSYDNNLPRLKSILECGRMYLDSDIYDSSSNFDQDQLEEDQIVELEIEMEQEEMDREEGVEYSSDPESSRMNFEVLEHKKDNRKTNPTSTTSSSSSGSTTIKKSSPVVDSKAKNSDQQLTYSSCSGDWRLSASQEITFLIRSLDASSAILQSPLLPEESSDSSTS